MSNKEFLRILEEKGGVLAIDDISTGKEITVLACIKPGNYIKPGKSHILKTHFFIGYVGFFSAGPEIVCRAGTCKFRKPTIKEYLRLMEEAKKFGIGYNRKTNKTYESNR